MKNGTLIKNTFLLLRPVNLAMIVLSFLLERYFVVKPFLLTVPMESAISKNAYLILIVSTVLVTAGGYVINNYFDSDIDQINKPGRNAVGFGITKFNALVLYFVLTISGIAGSYYFGRLTGIKFPLLFFVISATLLYLYSAIFKKHLLIGNIIVSFLTALTIMLPLIFDTHAWHEASVRIVITAYSLFAFFLTLIREIIKDCEDVEGDAIHDAYTLPVIAGLRASRIISAILCFLLIAVLCYIQFIQLQWENPVSFGYVIIFIQLPLLLLGVKTILAKDKLQDHFNSNLSKAIMLTGMLSMVIFYLSW